MKYYLLSPHNVFLIILLWACGVSLCVFVLEHPHINLIDYDDVNLPTRVFKSILLKFGHCINTYSRFINNITIYNIVSIIVNIITYIIIICIILYLEVWLLLSSYIYLYSYIIQNKINIHCISIYNMYVSMYIFLKIMIRLLWLLCSFAKWGKKDSQRGLVICLNSPSCNLRDQNRNLGLSNVKACILITTLNWIKAELIC